MKHLKSFLVVLLFSSNCFAFEDVFISLLQKPEPFIATSANTTVITREEIETSIADNVLELLESKKGLFVRDWYGNGTKAEIDLRGFGEPSASNVLVLLNGNRMNNIDMSNVDWSSISLKEVERIEIVYGRGSVLYGDNASAGVINIITKKPEESKIQVSGKYGSFSTTDISFDLSRKINENLSSRLCFNNFNSGGFRKNSKVTNNNLTATASGKINENIDFNARIGLHMDEYGLPGTITKNDYENNELTKTSNPDDKAYTPSDFILQNKFSIKNAMGNTNVDLNYRNRTSDLDMVSWSTYETRNTNTSQVVIRHSIDTLLLDNPNYLQFGVDIFDSQYIIDSYASKERTTKTREVEIKRNTIALYFLNKIDFLNNFNLTAGFRTEKSDNSFIHISEVIPNSVNSFEISCGWVYNKKLNLSLDFVNSYRFPKTDEYYSVWTGLNENLKPQDNYQTSLNMKYLLSSDYSLIFTLYNMDVKDEILCDQSGSNVNYESTNHQGIEFETSIKPFDFLKCNLFYSYTLATFTAGDYKDKEIPLVPQNKAGLNLSVSPLNNLSLNLTAKHTGQRRAGGDFSNTQDKIEDYNIVDFSLVFTRDPFNIKLGINNLLDTKYTPLVFWGGYYPGPEINYFISVNFLI